MTWFQILFPIIGFFGMALALTDIKKSCTFYCSYIMMFIFSLVCAQIVIFTFFLNSNWEQTYVDRGFYDLNATNQYDNWKESHHGLIQAVIILILAISLAVGCVLGIRSRLQADNNSYRVSPAN